MKKSLTILISVGVIVSIACGIVFAQQQSYEGEDVASRIGAGIKDSVQNLLSNNDQIVPFNAESTDDAVGIVMGEFIPKDYFNMRASLYKATGYDDVAIEAWNAIKIEVYERKFAEEHDLLPTEDEIFAYSEEMRKFAESTDESHSILKSLVTSMGMTEDTYWNEYQPKYEAPLQLIKANVAEYNLKNNLQAINPAEIEGEILDQAYFDSF